MISAHLKLKLLSTSQAQTADGTGERVSLSCHGCSKTFSKSSLCSICQWDKKNHFELLRLAPKFKLDEQVLKKR